MAFKRSRRLGGVAIFVITSVLMFGSSYLTPESVLFKKAPQFFISLCYCLLRASVWAYVMTSPSVG
jgi:hypothetical protein